MEKNKLQKFELKKPTIVRMLALCFLLAPAFNMANALFAAGLATWYSPKSWISLFLHLPVTEQGLHGLVIIAGILLLKQRKSSWTVAVMILFGVSIFNIVSTILQGEKLQILSGANMLINMGALVVCYFFRYPYLDQRDHILSGMAQRFTIDAPVMLNQKIEGRVKNISTTGCFISVANYIEFQVNDEVQIVILNSKDVLQARVVFIKDGLGLQFMNLSLSQKDYLNKFIDSIKSQS